LQFQLTVNVAALVIDFIVSVAGFYPPLKAVQLLWVNLIMDSLAALALGTEKPTPDLLNRKPYGRSGKIISNVAVRNIIVQSAYQLIACFILVWAGDIIWNIPNGNQTPGATVHYTIIFNVFVLCQIFNMFNARRVAHEINVFDGLFTKGSFNIIFCGLVGGIAVVQVLLVEFGGDFTVTSKLSIVEWLSCIAIAFISIPLGFVMRLIKVPLEDFEKERISEFGDKQIELKEIKVRQ